MIGESCHTDFKRTHGKQKLYTILLAQLLRDEVDIVPIEFAMTQIRSTVVDYLLPISESHQRLFLRNPADSPNWMAYIEPLTWDSWAVLSLIILAAPVAVTAYMYSGKAKSMRCDP